MAQLGQRGERDGGLPPSGGKSRKAQLAEHVKARVDAFVDDESVPAGVQPLNPGFFKMQRMRHAKRK